MKNEWLLALGCVGLFLLVLGLPQDFNFVSLVAADQTNQSGTTLTVTAIVDATFNCSSVSFGSLSPGAANITATSQCNMTIYANTNTNTTMSINASDLNRTGGGGSMTVGNLTYTNNSGTSGTCPTQMAIGFYSGACGSTPFNYTNWVNKPDPVSDAYNLIFLNASVPALQTKGTYTGYFYVKVIDVG